MQTGRWICVGLMVVALAAGACEDDAMVAPAGGAEAGAGGDGTAGSPTGEPVECAVEDDCESYGDCSTLEELQEDCNDLVAYRSSCGGTYVEQPGVVTLETWVFDVEGELIGGSSEDEGRCSWWGEQCGPVGEGEPLCNAVGECVEHATCAEWGANFYCPEQLANVQVICDLGGVDVESFASDCGGTYVHATNGVQDVKYTFDADGELIGALSWGDVGDCDQWGTHCGPRGAPEASCGAGGADTGGAGAGGEGAGGQGGAR